METGTRKETQNESDMIGLDELTQRRYNNIITQLRFASPEVIESRIISENLREHLKVLIAICQERIDQDYLTYSVMEIQRPGEKEYKPITEEELNRLVNQQGYPRLKFVLQNLLSGENKSKQTESKAKGPLTEFEMIFDPEKLSCYLELEEEFLQSQKKRKRKTPISKVELAGFIGSLIKNDFIIKKYNFEVKNDRQIIRKLFQSRFKIDIQGQLEKSNLSTNVYLKVWSTIVKKKSDINLKKSD